MTGDSIFLVIQSWCACVDPGMGEDDDGAAFVRGCIVVEGVWCALSCGLVETVEGRALL